MGQTFLTGQRGALQLVPCVLSPATVSERTGPRHADDAPAPSSVAHLAGGGAHGRVRSDARLVSDSLAGIEEASREVWERYEPLVRRLIVGVMGSDLSVDDLVQEVFLSFFRGSWRLEDRSCLRNYLAATAIRQAAQEQRRRRVRRLEKLTRAGEVPEIAAISVNFELREELRALLEVLGASKARRRDAFVLRHVYGLEMKEASLALDVSESTLRREVDAARALIARSSLARPRLAALLERYRVPWANERREIVDGD